MTRVPQVHGPFATLVRTFLGRFFENDLTSNAGDVKTMFFAFLAVLAIPGAVVPLFLAHPTPGLPGWDRIALEQGVEVLRAISRTDKVFYLGFAMITAGIVSAMTWNTLIVDRRDGLILGALPLRATAIVGAKLVALAAFVSGVAAAMHLLASLSFGVFLANHNTFDFAMRGIAGHFIASSAAGIFVLCSAAAAQGLALALMGPRRFARVSPVLQAALVVAILGTVIAIPAISGAVVVTLGGVPDVTGEAHPWILRTPPLWFLGLYESVIGTSDPTLLRLARTAVVAAAAPALAILVSYPLAYRRLMRTVVEQSDSPRRLRLSAAVIEALTRLVGRDPEIRAVAQFFLATLARHQRQRLVVATAFGLAAVWGLPAWMPLASRSPEPEIGLLQWAMTAPLFLVAGLRMAAAFPADTASSWIFSVLPPSTRNLRAAVERVILLVAVVPVVTLFSLAFWRMWGPEIAVIHALFSLSVVVLFLQCLLWRFDAVPCTRPWNPGAINLRFWWPAYLAIFLILTQGLPVFEWDLVRSPVVAACVIAFFMFIAYHLRAIAIVRPTVPADDAAGVLTSALKARWLSRRVPVDDDASWSGTVPHGDARAHALLHGSRRRSRWLAMRDDWRDVLAAATPSPGVLRRDIALALRRLRKAPVFTTFSVLTLGGGVAATTLAFAVIHALLWTRPPIPEFDRLVNVSGERFAGGRSRDGGVFSWPDFLDLRAQQTTFGSLAASTWHQVSFVGGQASAIVNAGAVNGEFFQTFGLRAAAGRLIEPADDRPDAAPVVVLSYNFWRLRFSADPGAIGTEVRVNGDRYRIVGVAPPGFNGADLSNVGRAGAIWVPLQTASGEVPLFRNGRQQTVTQLLIAGDRDARWIGVSGRLAPGRTIEQASAEVRVIGRAVEEFFPTPRQADSRGSASRFGRLWFVTEVRDDRPLAFGRLFIALVGFVLLIGATNLANLALARGASREHEFAVRRALGASRADLIREHLVESAFVGAAAGGVAWLLVTTFSKRLVMEIPGRADQFLLLDPHVSGPVLVFAVVAGLSALAVAGLWPALQLTGARQRGGLTSAGGTTPLHWSFHRRVIRWQVAGSAALLFLAAASISAIVTNARHAAGIDVDRLALATFSFSDNRYDQVRGRAAIDAVLADVSRQPGVATAAASGALPFDGRRVGSEWPVTRTDEPLAAHDDPSRSVHLVPATAQIFQTLGVDLLRGRSFGPADTSATSPVAVVNDTLARRLWGTPDVVGRDLVLWTPLTRREASAPAFRRVTVVGVASDTDAGSPGSREAGVMYLPIDQHPISRAVFTVRSSGDDPLLALGALRSAIARSAPDFILGETGTGPILLARAGLALSVVGALVTSIGGAALLLAMTGLFGIVSELVSRRSREFGVRAALGASQRGIMQLVLIDGVKPVLGGIALGAFAGAVGRSIIASVLSLPMPAVDPVEFLAVAVLLVCAAAGACYWPARRAARVDPTVALRNL